jgi:tetratricopeptide (TPR) repeat protein
MQLDQLVEKAKQAYGKKKYKEAANLFNQAADEYLSVNDPLMAAEMKNNQSVAYLQDGNSQASLAAVLGTDEVFASAGDKKRQGMAVANKAAALGDLKRIEEAIAFYEESAEIFEGIGELDLRADVMRSVAKLRVSQGKFTDAVISMQDGLIEVRNPTIWQRILKKLIFMRLWR